MANVTENIPHGFVFVGLVSVHPGMTLEEDRTLLAFFSRAAHRLLIIIHKYCRALQINKKIPPKFFILCIFQGRVAFFVKKTF